MAKRSANLTRHLRLQRPKASGFALDRIKGDTEELPDLLIEQRIGRVPDEGGHPKPMPVVGEWK